MIDPTELSKGGPKSQPTPPKPKQDPAPLTPPDAWSDAECVEKIRSGDDRGFETLVERYLSAATAFVKRRVKGNPRIEWEGIALAALFAVYQQIKSGKYIEQGRFKAYLFGQANFQVGEYCRAHNKFHKFIHCMSEITVPDHKLSEQQQSELREQIEQAAESLSEKERAALFLRHMDDEDVSYIAERLELSTVQAYRIIHAAKNAFRDNWKPP